MRIKRKRTAVGRWLFLCFLMLLFSFTTAMAAPEVNVMPNGDTDESAYTWAGNALTIWGNVRGGTGPYTYEWDINNDGTADYSGAVANVNDIACSHTYAASGIFEAKLTVTDSTSAFDSAIVRIKVLPSMTKAARIELAIERGLKWLYLREINSGARGQIYYYNSYGSAGAETASAVLAFENRNHKPCTQDLDGDGDVDAADRALWEKDHIYAETVHNGLDYLISTLIAVSIGNQAAGNPDTNGNGIGIADSYGNRQPYKIGSYMMALVGAGGLASGAPDLVATTGGANVAGRTYKEIVQDMVDWCAWAQVEPSRGVHRGGWRYGPNYSSSDNSACQWPAIGMEAAEFGWGCVVPAFVKTENQLWTSYSQYFTGYETYAYYGAFGYDGKGTGVARTGAGICQLSFQGAPKDDPRIVAAGNYLGTYKHYAYSSATAYAMYAIAKGARVAKIDTNSDGIGDTYSEIQLLGGWDWYEEYSDRLLSTQQSNGSWSLWSYTRYVFDTAWAVEILTKNVYHLRPIASIVATPDTTPANSPVNFDISGSFHQDSTRILTTWELDFDNDGMADASGSFPVAAPIPFAGYPDTGADYSASARLKVTDDIGDIGEKVIPVNITSGNVPPVADPGGPYSGSVGAAITFDGSASYDPNEGAPLNDSIVSWEWDLDGDGQYDDATGMIVQNTWSAPYQGLVGLKVTDSFGLSSTSTVYTDVFVVDLWPENYVLVSRTRISRYVYEYEYKFDMRNRGTADALNVECTMETYPAQITIVDGHVSFGDIAAGVVVTSSDTFKFRQDRRYPVADFQLKWRLEYDDSTGGDHIVFLDFPLY